MGMSTVVKRNTSIPVRKTEEYTTESDYQDGLDVDIFEGERTCTDGNNKLGSFQIHGIHNVSAKDTVTGAANQITIVAKGRNSKEDVEKMLAEAEQFKKEDELFKARAEAKNQLEALISQTLEIARDNENKDLEEAAKETRDWYEENEDDVAVKAE